MCMIHVSFAAGALLGSLVIGVGGFSFRLFHLGKRACHLVCNTIYTNLCFCEFHAGIAWSFLFLLYIGMPLGTIDRLSIQCFETCSMMKSQYSQAD